MTRPGTTLVIALLAAPLLWHPLPVIDDGDEAFLAPWRIDPRAASVGELSLLPGVGPTIAGRIAEAAQAGMMEGPEDLDAVRGIGPLTLERMAPLLIWDDHEPGL